MNTSASPDHRLRRILHDELHARPSLYFEAPANVWHVAMLIDPAMDVPASLLMLPDVEVSPDRRHGIAPLGEGRLKWERHTEFLTITFVFPARPGQRWLQEPDRAVALCRTVAGERIAAVHVRVEAQEHAASILGTCGFVDPVASHVGGRDGTAWSDFRLDAGGYVRILFGCHQLNAYRTGRMVRRLLEIETYRMMALLGLPLAREAAQKLNLLNVRLTSLVRQMRTETRSEKDLLFDITRLSSE